MTKKQAYEEALKASRVANRIWRMADGEEKPEYIIEELKFKADEAEAARQAAFKAYMESDE